MLGAAALAEFGVAMEAEGEWAKRLIAGLARALELCGEAPGPARALLVCPAEVGAVGARCRAELIEGFAGLVAPEARLARRLPPRAATMAVSGVIGLLGEEVARGEAAELAELGFALLVPLMGPIEASEKVARLRVGALG
jgi:hypothetical protein